MGEIYRRAHGDGRAGAVDARGEVGAEAGGAELPAEGVEVAEVGRGVAEHGAEVDGRARRPAAPREGRGERRWGRGGVRLGVGVSVGGGGRGLPGRVRDGVGVVVGVVAEETHGIAQKQPPVDLEPRLGVQGRDRRQAPENSARVAGSASAAYRRRTAASIAARSITISASSTEERWGGGKRTRTQ